MRIILLIVLLASSGYLYSQSSEDLRLAKEFYDARDINKARKHIDLAIQDQKTENLAETWFYQGKIYYSLATTSETPSSSSDKIDHYKTSIHGFEKAKALDEKGLLDDDILKVLQLMNEVFLNEGLISYNSKDYPDAAQYYELSYQSALSLGSLDTIAAYNSALAYEKSKKIDEALEMYQVCAKVGYNGAETYTFMYYLLFTNGRGEEAFVVLEEGRTKYPNDLDLLKSQLNQYLIFDKEKEAIEILTQLLKREPNEAYYYFTRGHLSEKLEMDGASIVSDYKKAIEIKSNYFDPIYGLGNIYYKKGIDLVNQSKVDKNKAQSYIDQSKIEFKKSMEYLEKAHKLKFKHEATQESLKVIYKTLELTDKYDELVKTLEK